MLLPGGGGGGGVAVAAKWSSEVMQMMKREWRIKEEFSARKDKKAFKWTWPAVEKVQMSESARPKEKESIA